jgi:uncharacterized protein (DUF488 family)
MLNHLFTIGHSNHPLDRFLELLAQHQIVALADIRRFPGSRKHPQFNQDNLGVALQDAGVEYHWFEKLGGRRRSKQPGESVNVGLRNEGFRNYADYMLTDEFQEGVAELLKVARKKRLALMCAEGLFWQCHRRLVSDFLTANEITVQHIMPNGELRPHTLTEGANMGEGTVIYPGEKTLFG